MEEAYFPITVNYLFYFSPCWFIVIIQAVLHKSNCYNSLLPIKIDEKISLETLEKLKLAFEVLCDLFFF